MGPDKSLLGDCPVHCRYVNMIAFYTLVQVVPVVTARNVSRVFTVGSNVAEIGPLAER